jgi:hypothetical protein
MPFKKPLSVLANADEHCELRIAVKSRGAIVGTGKFTIAGLVDVKTVNLTHNNQPAGSVVFRQFSKIERPSFIQILRSGWQMSMIVGIDYTASNGNPSQPNSLHALNNNNQY